MADSSKNLSFNVDSDMVVYGYIRRKEKKFEFAIPDAITRLCYLYYFVCEQFEDSPDMLGTGVKILGQRKSIPTMKLKRAYRGWITVFGQFVIDCAEYCKSKLIWTINVPHVKVSVFEIGIIELCESVDLTKKTDINAVIEACRDKSSAFGMYVNDTDNGNVVLDGTSCEADLSKKGLKNLTKIDIDTTKDIKVRMELNIANQTLRYFINAKDFNIYFKNIKFKPKYLFCASLYNKEASIEIIDFSIEHSSSSAL